MKFKKTLAILTLPFMCLLSSCKEEPLVYGTKSIFERPANYQGLYWFGDKVDINDDSLYMLHTSDDEIDPCNYSRLFAESKYVYESGQIPYVSSVYYLYYYSAFPSVIYKITRGYGGHYRSNGQYFVTGISIKTTNVKSLYGVDITASDKEKERKFAEYNFQKVKMYGQVSENVFYHRVWETKIQIYSNALSIVQGISDEYMKYDEYIKYYEKGFDPSVFTDDSDLGARIYFLGDSWFKKDN